WYEDGKMLNKRKSFTDFIASAEHLISERYTSPDKLAIRGGSAGGLLIGAVTNMRPDLFKAVVANVPFVDVLNTMLDPDIPLTVIEYEEWGNPNEKEYYDTIKSYSPYDNVQSKDYPNMLITAGLNDPRVQVWEPAKWTARLRALKTDDNILLLKTEMGAGHFGPSGRYDYLRKMAFRYAFILDVLGMTE
ncbi:MAG: prolyl oligopeptidase family serine peptidase, partial [Fidelibacterota bacterium]